MVLIIFKMIKITAIILLFSAQGAEGYESRADSLLLVAREMFYQSVEDKTLISPTIKKFEYIKDTYEHLENRAQVYIGALLAVKAKHSFFPHNKIIWAKRGLSKLDAGLHKNPDDLEALFVHGSICHFLPFFFRRGNDAVDDFKRIVELLPQEHHRYDQKVINDIFNFLIDKSKLDQQNIESVKKMRIKLGYANEENAP